MATHSRSAPLLLLLLIFLSCPMVSTWLDPFLPMTGPTPGVVISGPVLFAKAQKNSFSLFSRSKPDVNLDDQESIKREKEVLEAFLAISSLEKSKEHNQSKKAKVDNQVSEKEKQDKEVSSMGEEESAGGRYKDKDKAENKPAKKLLPKREGENSLLNAVVAESPPSQLDPPTVGQDDNDNKDKDNNIATNTDSKPDKQIQGGEKKEEQDSTKDSTKTTTKKKKKKTGHEDDIIHEHDHADNDAYDDIIWYDGPHSDDEDEHGDHHDDDHDDDHHDEGHDDDDEESTTPPELKAVHQVLSNLQKLSGTKPKSKSNAKDTGKTPSPSEHTHDEAHDGPPGTFHHSGADAIQGSISPTEFCLRLKHECESTCREFKAGVLYISTTCEAGSVAELLFWGRCCQIGQEHRVNAPSLNGTKKSKKNAQGQAGQAAKQQEKQGQKVLQGQPQKEQKQGEQENDPAQQYLKRQQKRHEVKRAAEADLQKSTP